MSSTEDKSVTTHKFGQNDENKNIKNSENNNNTSPSTQGGEDNNKNTSTSSFINETDFQEIQNSIGSEERSLLKLKLINNQNTNIPIEGLEKFTKWLALSTEVLKSNKNVVKYNLNTMTNNSAQATGVVENLDQNTNVGEGIRSRQWRVLNVKYDRESTLANASVGFPAVHEKIDELLVQRLTESIGKQSPINGKVLDYKNIINANVLPVIKNGSIDYTHRILETVVQMLSIMNITPSSGNIRGVFSHFTVEDLQSQEVRTRLETLTNDTNTGRIQDINLVLKSVNQDDMMREIKACIRGSLQLVADKKVKINTYGLNKLLDTGLFAIDGKYDVSSLAMDTKYNSYFKNIPFEWLTSNPSSNQLWINDNDDGTWHLMIFGSSADRTVVKNWLDEDRGRAIQLIGSTSITIAGTTYNYNDNYRAGDVSLITLTNTLNQSNYVAFENYDDIINAIDLITYLTCQWYYYNTSTGRTYCALTRSQDESRIVTPSSIWARIAMIYGQLKYVNVCERNLGDQSLISNKVFNYAYYIAGSRAKLVQNSYGSFITLRTHIPSLIYPSFMNADRILKFKHDAINCYIPLLNYSSDKLQTNIIQGFKPTTATGYIFAEYFTDPRWWRYDYFGNLKQIAPSQRLGANQTDQDYDENSEFVFTNVAQPSDNAVASIGTATIRFTANGQYSPVELQSISYSPNTALKLIIPNLFKTKKRTKCMLLHGLDLSYRAAPVWYGYYDYVRTMVDDGSFEEDILDELF